ncbi:hypothetical protein AAC387_Pa07g1455 [Persea americana]
MIHGKYSYFKCSTTMHISLSPYGKLLVFVGENHDGLLVDSHTGKTITRLCCHLDFLFASAWLPNGHSFVTGNPDKTYHIWYNRNISKSVSLLTLSMSDTRNGYDKELEIGFFCETTGVSFSPDTVPLQSLLDFRTARMVVSSSIFGIEAFHTLTPYFKEKEGEEAFLDRRDELWSETLRDEQDKIRQQLIIYGFQIEIWLSKLKSDSLDSPPIGYSAEGVGFLSALLPSQALDFRV